MSTKKIAWEVVDDGDENEYVKWSSTAKGEAVEQAKQMGLHLEEVTENEKGEVVRKRLW